MTEGLADAGNDVTDELLHLYRRWAGNGLGLMLTGNIQVDRTHLERPGNIVVDDRTDMDALRRLAAVGTERGYRFWVQINHTGRQTPASVNPQPYAPSAISLLLAEANCGAAREMPESEIEATIARFANCARLWASSSLTYHHAPERAARAYDLFGRKIPTSDFALLEIAHRNARPHGRKQIRKIADAIERFGFVSPIIVDSGLRIVAGQRPRARCGGCR